MPKPVFTLAVAWAAFDAMVFDDGVTRTTKTHERRVFYAGAHSQAHCRRASMFRFRCPGRPRGLPQHGVAPMQWTASPIRGSPKAP